MTREPVRGHQDLLAWQRGVDLVELVYRTSSDWPKDERFGLTGQARRAAVSIPANIAEGYGRGSDKEFARFPAIARGSLRELETHLHIAQRLGFLSAESFQDLRSAIDDVGRFIFGLSRRLQLKIEAKGEV